MKKLPRIQVDFDIEGKDFDLQKFSDEIGIQPDETRTPEEWPDAIKNNKDLPEELRPRYVWCISERMKKCKITDKPVRKIMERLTGKEEIIIAFCKKHKLSIGLSIMVDAKIMELPELVLYPDIVSYFGQLDAEIGFDIMVY